MRAKITIKIINSGKKEKETIKGDRIFKNDKEIPIIKNTISRF